MSKQSTALAAAQAKADRLHTLWMTRLDQLRQDHPDYPEAALMQLALKDAGRELEATDRQAADQWEKANSSALAEHMVSQAVKREREPRKHGADKVNSQYIEPRAWVIAEWKRTKGQHLYQGVPSKAKFVRHITGIPPTGNSIFRKATESLASPSTIEKRWLNGID